MGGCNRGQAAFHEGLDVGAIEVSTYTECKGRIRVPRGETMSEIVLEDLTKRFGNITAVDRLSTTIKSGEFFVVVGADCLWEDDAAKVDSGSVGTGRGEHPLRWSACNPAGSGTERGKDGLPGLRSVSTHEGLRREEVLQSQFPVEASEDGNRCNQENGERPSQQAPDQEDLLQEKTPSTLGGTETESGDGEGASRATKDSSYG